MKIVFMGTPGSAVPFLDALVANAHQVPLVVSQPDRPAGRGGALRPPPVKTAAARLGIPMFQPEKLKTDEAAVRLSEPRADLFVIVAYRVLPPRILGIPKRGCLNVHFSLLPKYRGAAPVAWALINGETRTGVTTMLIDAGIDTGGMLLQEACPIDPAEDAARLTEKLTGIGVRLMLESITGLASGALHPVAQQEADVTLAPKLMKEYGKIDWLLPAGKIHNIRRGLTPWPGTFALLEGKRIKVLDTRFPEHGAEPAAGPPGQILGADRNGIQVRCGEGSVLLITEVQPEGKRPMSGASLIAGRYVKVGDRFDVT